MLILKILMAEGILKLNLVLNFREYIYRGSMVPINTLKRGSRTHQFLRENKRQFTILISTVFIAFYKRE